MMRKKPMLAYPVSDKPIDYNNTIFMQPKLDGVRCLIQSEDVEYHEPNTGRLIKAQAVKAYSRTGKEWKNIDHILQALAPFFQANPTVILDGELYNHALRDDFEKIISCVRKQKPTAIDRAESRRLVQFHCYDIVDETLPFVDRTAWLNKQKLSLQMAYGVRKVHTESVLDEKDAKLFHNHCLDQGYEGSILRTNEVYKCGRSWSLRKFKDFHDAEATLTDWVEGKGKRKGTIGKFMAIDADGNTFGMPVMDNFKKLQTMFKEMQTWVGKEATFTYFERTKAGSYRHPLFKAIRDYE